MGSSPRADSIGTHYNRDIERPLPSATAGTGHEQNLLFAPELDLGKYIALLQEAGNVEEEITDVLNRIRRQGGSSAFLFTTRRAVVNQLADTL